MEIDLALAADAATIDSSGKLNLLGVFDQVGVASLPARHDRVSLVLRLLGGANEAGAHQISIALSAPSGKEMLSLNGNISVAPGRRSLETGIRIPHVINLDGIVFEEPGIHTFEIAIDGRHQATLPLSVVPTAGPRQGMA